MIKNLLTIIVAFAAMLYILQKINTNDPRIVADDNQAEPAEMNLDSVANVLKLITDEVYISVTLNMKNNYKTDRYFLFKSPFTKISSTEHKNEATLKYKVKFSMGFDLTDRVSKYLHNGTYNIPKLEEDIQIIAKEVERFKIEEMGDFTFKQIDSLDRQALQMASDSLGFYLFRVKIIKQKPVITHKVITQ